MAEERTLNELSEDAKSNFAAGNHQEATNLLNEAVERFPFVEGSRLKQGSDGSFVVGVKKRKMFRGEPVNGLDGKPEFVEVDEPLPDEDE